MGVVGITFLLQILIIEVLGKFTSTVRLSWKLWSSSMAIALLSWPLDVVGKCIPVPEIPLEDLCQSFFRRQKREPEGLLSEISAGDESCRPEEITDKSR